METCRYASRQDQKRIDLRSAGDRARVALPAYERASRARRDWHADLTGGAVSAGVLRSGSCGVTTNRPLRVALTAAACFGPRQELPQLKFL